MSTYTTRGVSDGRHASRDPAQPNGPARAADGAGGHLSHAADDAEGPLSHKTGRLSPLQALAVARERLVWNRRADRWDDEGSAGLSEVVAEVVRECRASLPADAVAVDLGAGSGQLTIPLAEGCSRILAVDVSARLLERLATKAAARGIANIQRLTHPIESLDLPPASVDLVVSNYTLHHLRDIDKQRLLKRCYTWLRPGGRIVIGDMMFGRGASASDRVIIASKTRALLQRGPGGWWRLLKNAVRFSLRLGEKPLPPHRWEALALAAGLHDVSITPILAEAYLLTATKPPADKT